MTAHPEVFRALGVLCEPPDPAHRTVAASLDLAGWPAPDEETGLFTVLLLPYAALYVGPEGMLGGEAAGTDRRVLACPGLRGSCGAGPPGRAARPVRRPRRGRAGPRPTPARRAAAPPGPCGPALGAPAHLGTHLRERPSPPAVADHHGDWAALLTETLLSEAAALDAPATPPAHLSGVPRPPRSRGGGRRLRPGTARPRCAAGSC